MQIDSYSAEDIFELLVSYDWELVLNDLVENLKRSALEGFEAPVTESWVTSMIVLQLTRGLDPLKVASRC
jgi:hypothetical protein